MKECIKEGICIVFSHAQLLVTISMVFFFAMLVGRLLSIIVLNTIVNIFFTSDQFKCL